MLIAIVVLFVTSPFADDFRFGVLVESIATTLVLLAGVLVVGRQRSALAIAIVLVAPALIARWFDLFQHSALSRVISLVTAILFIAFVLTQLLLFVLRTRYVGSGVLSAGISAYLLIGLLFAFCYSLCSVSTPDAFLRVPPGRSDRPLMGFDALYFSFVTLSTVGYGDIVPAARVARMLATLEAMSGMFYVTIFIARLVTLYSRRPPAGHTFTPP